MKHPGDSKVNQPVVFSRPDITLQNDSVMRFEIKPTVDVQARKLLEQALQKISEMERKMHN